MKIAELTLKNYRNFVNETITPGDGVNIIFGDNAQGKTNLLEAIWMFTGGRSFRGATDADLVTFQKKFGELNIAFEAEQRKQTAQLRLINQKRQVILNGIEKKTPSEMIGTFCASLFTPEHLGLVKEGPSGRRKFIDAAICQIKPSYCSLLAQYRRTLLQRNTLLKDISYHSELIDTLEIWEQKLVKYGTLLVQHRRKYCRILEEKSKKIYQGISNGKEEFSISYQTELFATEGKPIKEIEADYQERLQRGRKIDLQQGFTGIGPHRDDLFFQINEKSAKKFASQGQQRSIVLSLKLAEAEILKEMLKEQPIVLLDDVMSELDHKRQDFLLDTIRGWQVFITCCDLDGIARIENCRKFKIRNGCVLT